MARRTRIFLVVAASVLAVGLGTGLVASYMGLQNLTIIGGDGPAELAYVPADARLLAYADVRDVMDSALRERLSQLQPGTGNGADRFREQTGIDIETDIDHVVAAVSGPGGTSDPPLVLARGRFDEVRIEGLIRERGGRVEEYQGRRLLVQQEGSGELSVSFLEPGLVAVGPTAAVRAAVDTKAAGSDVTGNAEVMRLVRDIDEGDLWAVARFDDLAGGRLPAEVAGQLPAITWFSATGMVGSGLEGQLRVETRDETAAQNLREVVRGFMALARMQVGQNAELAEALNSIQLVGEGTTVGVSFSVPSELVDALDRLRANGPPRPDPPAPPQRPGPPAL